MCVRYLGAPWAILFGALLCCQSPSSLAEGLATGASGGEPTAGAVNPDTVELKRFNWSIGVLEAETVVFLENDRPQQRTTVWNNTSETVWWQDFYLNRYSYSEKFDFDEASFKTHVDSETGEVVEEYVGLGGGGGGGFSSRCRSRFSLARNDSFCMKPGSSRLITDAEFSDSVVASACDGWSFSGEGSLPSSVPFSEWPALAFDIKVGWSDDEGCWLSVEPREKP